MKKLFPYLTAVFFVTAAFAQKNAARAIKAPDLKSHVTTAVEKLKERKEIVALNNAWINTLADLPVSCRNAFKKELEEEMNAVDITYYLTKAAVSQSRCDYVILSSIPGKKPNPSEIKKEGTLYRVNVFTLNRFGKLLWDRTPSHHIKGLWCYVDKNDALLYSVFHDMGSAGCYKNSFFGKDKFVPLGKEKEYIRKK